MKLDRDLVRRVSWQLRNRGIALTIASMILQSKATRASRSTTTSGCLAVYLEMLDLSFDDDDTYAPRCLTLRGHEFLDTIRDEWIWKQTRDAATAVGGGTIELLFSLAKGFARQKLSSLGIDIGRQLASRNAVGVRPW